MFNSRLLVLCVLLYVVSVLFGCSYLYSGVSDSIDYYNLCASDPSCVSQVHSISDLVVNSSSPVSKLFFSQYSSLISSCLGVVASLLAGVILGRKKVKNVV